ncbi:MAG TPA: hypothetical protein VHC69_33900 [Polyangiaceae bacterium]|nr:hypothetical protein [Polyangiaceae bacterium]HVW30416.1 hypothetical protein [Polyangiaceae bacterium]
MKHRAGSQWVYEPTCFAAVVLAFVAGCGSSSGNEGATGAAPTTASPSAAAGGAGGSAATPASTGSAPTTPTTGSGGAPASTSATSTASGGGVPASTGGAVTGSGGAVIANGGAVAAGVTPSVSGAAGTSSAAGSAGAPAGCAQGTFCQAADDLAPPDAAQGFQLVSPSSITVQPGAEAFYCFYKNVPATTEVSVGGYRSYMTKGSSHHFITYLTGGNGSTTQPDGTLQQCGFGAGQWVYATSQSGLIVGMDMPATVGLPLPVGSQLMMNMHFFNVGDAVSNPVVKLNVLYANDVQYKAGAMVSFNTQINVPPGGTQTVGGTCSAPAGSNFFLMSTHTHKWATSADVNYVSGGQTTNIVHTTDYENPGTHVWQAPNFLTTKSGDTFTYSCSYQNDENFAITVGETASRNEMCMAIGYYFPAGSAPCF